MKTHHALACIALAATFTLPATATTEPPLTWEWGANFGVVTELMPFFGADDFPFERFALFTLDGRFDLLSRVETEAVGRLDVAGGMVTLWRSNGDGDYRNDELIGGYDFGATPMQQSFAGMDSGEYFYLFEGVASGMGNLVFTASISAVPEPGQWALMLAGLGAVGNLARRRMSA